MLRKANRMALILVLFILFSGVLALAIPRLMSVLYARPKTFTITAAPVTQVAIVFGAGLHRDGRPTSVLRDRVSAAASLYFDEKVEKLLMSGDHRFATYNEPGAMREYALSLGVPDEAIVLDYAGRRTYDTCYRAKHIFGLQKVVLVSQGFHLPRAIYTCNHLGLPAVGVPSDLHPYRRLSRLYWSLREMPAMLMALWEVHVTRPLPVLGRPEPIFHREAS